MLAFWPEKAVIDHPLNYNLYKKKDMIERDFICDYGILQKVVYDNTVIGYFVACRIDKEVLMEITNPAYSHSDRWSAVFDVVFDNYSYLTSSERGAIVTGLVYLVENKEEILI
jgi:hypothetical protein